MYTIARDGIHVGTTSNPEHWFPFTRGYTMTEGIHRHGYRVESVTDDAGYYRIDRDGEPVDFTRAPLAWFHRRHAYSMDHAIAHEGYTITRIHD